MLKILLQYKLTIVMMNCKCGNRSLFFEKTTHEGTFRVFKCDTEKSKRKGKCDFFYSQKIKDPIIFPPKPENPKAETAKGVNARKFYTKRLNKYISLFKNSKHLPIEYSTDYIANMNYILKRLNMPLYFENTETIESLEARISKNVCVKYTVSKNIYPIRLTEYPSSVAVPTKTKCTKRRKIKSKVKTLEVDFKNFIEEEEKSKQEEEIEKKSVCSDSDSGESVNDNDNDNDNEKDNDKDNTFDVDEYDSEKEDDIEDAGAFSD